MKHHESFTSMRASLLRNYDYILIIFINYVNQHTSDTYYPGKIYYVIVFHNIHKYNSCFDKNRPIERKKLLKMPLSMCQSLLNVQFTPFLLSLNKSFVSVSLSQSNVQQMSSIDV